MSSKEKQTVASKKGYYVPSRYKQAAETVSQQFNRSKDRSTLPKHSSGSSGSNNSSQDPNSSKSVIFQGSRGMTSTPASEGKLLLPCFEESVVSNSLSEPVLKERLGFLSSDFVKKNLEKKMKSHNKTLQSHGSVAVSSKNKKKDDLWDEKFAEAEVDLLYALYLQAAFLQSEAKEVQKLRNSSCIEKLRKMCGLISQYIQKSKSEQCSLKLITFILKVYEHLQKQEIILKPVYEVIPLLHEKYRTLGEAINNNKHKLHVKNMVLPDPSCNGDISAALEEIIDLITRFFESVPNYEEIILYASAMKNCVDSGEEMTDALKRGFNQIVEARDLYISEASLLMDP